MTKKKNPNPTGVRLPEDLRYMIERLAKKQGRSLSNMIINLLREALVK